MVLFALPGWAVQAQDVLTPRTDLLAKLCGEDGRDIPLAARQILQSTPDATAVERAWAQQVVQGFTAHRLRCAALR